MKWPRLVPPAVCCTPCTVVLTGAEGENGAPQAAKVPKMSPVMIMKAHHSMG